MAPCIPDQPSVAPHGAGSTLQENTPADQAATVREATATPSPRRTLLVVDDQPSVRASIAYFLEVCGYRTFQAESGEAAIDLLGKEQVDGVLLDVQMPKLNGLETSVRLNALNRASNRPVKIWFMTGIYYRELNEECAKAGGIAVFRKPFDWPGMLAELEQGLSSLPRFADQKANSAPNPT